MLVAEANHLSHGIPVRLGERLQAGPRIRMMAFLRSLVTVIHKSQFKLTILAKRELLGSVHTIHTQSTPIAANRSRLGH